MAVAVAQLAERSLPAPEICCSNPNIGSKIFLISVNSNLEKTNIKKKRPALAFLLKKNVYHKEIKHPT